MTNFQGRKILFKALVGSHNYNLNSPESDRDYKIFLIPSFDDLYSNKQFSHDIIGENEDLQYHDCRKLKDLFFKSNINFLEVLFSEDCQIANDLSYVSNIKLKNIFESKEDIARINLPYLWDACIGMYNAKRSAVTKATAGTQHLLDKYGFDTKQAQCSIRLLFFLSRYAENGFKSFKQAIWFHDTSLQKGFLMGLKFGNFTLEDYYGYADTILENISGYKDIYKSFKPNHDLYENLNEIIKFIVKEEMINGQQM